MPLEKFEHPEYEEIKKKWFEGKPLTDDEINVLFGLIEAKEMRLQAILEIAKG
jgi:hypothetical protein